MSVRHPFVTSRHKLPSESSKNQQLSAQIRRKRARAMKLAFEPLETRRLLTTLTGGQQFEFLDASGNTDRIVLTGNITAEIIGASVTPGGGATATLVDLPGRLNGNAVNGGFPTTTSTDTLFAIYVSQDDGTGSISVAQVPPLAVPPTGDPRPMEPYTGSIGALQVSNATDGKPLVVSAPDGSGAVLLGARSIAGGSTSTTTANIPILTAPVTQSFGVLDPSITTLHAGLIVAPGQNMKNFLFGGTILGEVHIHGSINTFYAGCLLTGNALGSLTKSVSDPQNFTVDGDIQNLLVRTSIGTDADSGGAAATYLTGFDMRVTGTLGTVQAGGSIIGSINGDHATNSLVADQTEIESKGAGTYDPWDDGMLGAQGGDTYFNNDTFATAQYISQSNNVGLQAGGSVVVDGQLQIPKLNDFVDYYAVPLMAGQTITVQVVSPTLEADVGVFDPSGREIATDYNVVNAAVTRGTQFQITTTMPGVYRFAVGAAGNPTFLASGGTDQLLELIKYQLVIGNVGNLGVGNIIAAGNLGDNSASGSAGFGSTAGDLGAVIAGGALFSNQDSGINTSIVVPSGNLRVVGGGTIGQGLDKDVEISVPNGSVGLIQSAGAMNINNSGIDSPAIGGDYQVVIAGGDLDGQLIADGSIGTIQAASVNVGSSDASSSSGGGNFVSGATKFQVNADNSGPPGTIDLIDVSGDFGSEINGGPSISTGVNGNVRYLHVGGTLYQDYFFGGISPDQAITYSPGQSTSIVDDSGTDVHISPNDITNTTVTTVASTTTDVAGTTTSTVTNADGSVTTTTTTKQVAGGNTTTTITVDTPGQLTITTYGIENSGGSAIVNLTSTGGVTINAAGGSAEIGTLKTTQAGTAVIDGATTSTTNVGNGTTVPLPSAPTLSASGTALNVALSGSGRLDVFDITGGQFNSISNTTGGEIVDVHATSVGSLSSSGAIGLPEMNLGTAIVPAATESNTYPYVQQHTGINITGSLVSVSAPTLGNLMVGGSIGSVNGTIDGPVVSGGSITAVNVGTGIASIGSGAVGRAGIFATDVIGNVTGGNGATIRGAIVGSAGITSVHLNNGSIINSTIGALSDFSMAQVFTHEFESPRYPSIASRPTLDIGSISTTGVGGIFGSLVVYSQLGSVSVNGGGFGIFETGFFSAGDGVIQSISADGYGLRGDFSEDGASIGSITATGDGSLSSVANYAGQVRLSESYGVDPNTGFAPNATSDLDVYLGTTATTPVIPNVTDTGVIEDCTFLGQRDLGSVRAYQIRGSDPDDGSVTAFNFANSIGSIVTTSIIDGMTLTTGKLGTFSPGGDVMHGSLQIAGIVKNLVLHGNFLDSSVIRATGKNGNIKNITVMGNMDGTIEADGGKINKAVIDGALDGAIISKTLTNLVLRGTLGNGALQIAGNVNSITTTGDLGVVGDTITINGKLGTLKVGGNLNANVVVGTTLTKAMIKGSMVTGATITVARTFSTLQIAGDFQAGAIVTTHSLKHKKVGGVDAGTVTLV